nr:MAG TPA: Oleosin [Caudoviricetes sp.]
MSIILFIFITPLLIIFNPLLFLSRYFNKFTF